ncbi:MAG: hypothetical protein JSW66_14530 [Phycisphaerales bacterium]|nr:MAG: hypothetical protein JSW66_14530 [Phycisphaerales bacterium]
MKYQTKPAKQNILVTLICLVLLLMNLGAIGGGARQRAKEMVCLSNLRQWGSVFAMDTEANNGNFYSGLGPRGYWWALDLDEDKQDWKDMKIWFCPRAMRPLFDENGNRSSEAAVFSAWGIYRPYDVGPNGISGSYGINGYVLCISGDMYESAVPASAGWRTPYVAEASNVPIFVDALRLDLWPLEIDSPAANEFEFWSSTNMARCCIDRHNGAVNVLFADWSSRKVGLKELWTLKWHRTFNTGGPWTQAGGVRPSDWPQWMRNFRNY